MRFQSLKYSRSISMPNGGRQSLEASVIVYANENPDQCFADLKTFVDEKMFPHNFTNAPRIATPTPSHGKPLTFK